VPIALLLAFAGGCLDAYTWMISRRMPALTLAIPVSALLVVLRCKGQREFAA
jgi:hypothetical protein